MFCPNCGNDCGSAKFCVRCGTEIGQEVKETETWSAGMPCPHCGGTVLDGPKCAFCGVNLLAPKLTETIGAAGKKIPLSEIDLNEYCERYWPDKAQAIKALNAESGIGIVAAKVKLDPVFDFYENQMEEYRNETELERSTRNLKFAWKRLWKISDAK